MITKQIVTLEEEIGCKVDYLNVAWNSLHCPCELLR